MNAAKKRRILKHTGIKEIKNVLKSINKEKGKLTENEYEREEFVAFASSLCWIQFTSEPQER